MFDNHYTDVTIFLSHTFYNKNTLCCVTWNNELINIKKNPKNKVFSKQDNRMATLAKILTFLFFYGEILRHLLIDLLGLCYYEENPLNFTAAEWCQKQCLQTVFSSRGIPLLNSQCNIKKLSNHALNKVYLLFYR